MTAALLARHDWTLAPAHIPLQPGEVHVWRAAHASAHIGEALLRTALTAHLGTAPSALALGHDAAGRPELLGPRMPGLSLALTHTQGLTLAAIGYVPGLGIDAERLRADLDVLGVAEACLTTGEFARLHALPEAARPAAFFRIWTRKEAVVKASGEGLFRPFASFELPAESEGALAIAGLPGEWFVPTLDAGPAHAAALAWRHVPARVRLWSLGD